MAEETPSKDEQQPEGKKSKKKLIIVAILGTLLIAGLGVGAALLLRKPKDDGAASSPEKAEATTEKKEEKSEHGEKPKEGGHGEKPKEEKSEHGAKSEHGEKKGEGKGEGSSKAEEGDSDVGASYNLKPFHLNLGNPLENRYIRLEMAIEYKGGAEQLKEIEGRLPQLRDAIISVASRKTREFLLGPDGKDQLRLEVLNRINQYMTRKVEAVYITDMIIE